MMIPPDSPHDLRGFPEADAYGPYYKVHLAGKEASTAQASSLYRFDSPSHRRGDFGSCYMATSREGAFVETLGGIRPLSPRHVEDRVITEMYTPSGLRIADLTAAWGMSSLDNYPLTQRWAEVLYDAGFNGAQYKPDHWLEWGFDYEVVVLWFEPGPNHESVKSGAPEPISPSLIRQLEGSGAIEILSEEPLAVTDITQSPDPDDEPLEAGD
jgi:hypothetical protein